MFYKIYVDRCAREKYTRQGGDELRDGKHHAKPFQISSVAPAIEKHRRINDHFARLAFIRSSLLA
ncbi:MAG TPA: hypothetical protein VJ180_07175 [Pyrinomonadaceae bacterium]|nr:hypothetical protein [Pyrinomonadaceae bacterium]